MVERGVETGKQRSPDRSCCGRIADDDEKRRQRHRGDGAECGCHPGDRAADRHRIEPEGAEHLPRPAGECAQSCVDVDGDHAGQQRRVRDEGAGAQGQRHRLAYRADHATECGGAHRRPDGDEDDRVELDGARRVADRGRRDVGDGRGQPGLGGDAAPDGFGGVGDAAAATACDVNVHLTGGVDDECGISIAL